MRKKKIHHRLLIADVGSSSFVIVKILLSLQNHSERFVFIAEWFDPNASLFRRYELLFYPGDGSVEMVNEPFFA